MNKKSPKKSRININIDTEALRKDIDHAVPVVKDRVQQASEIVRNGVKKIMPMRQDNPETRYYKILGLTFVGLMLIAILAGVATFLLTLRSPEAVAVPQLVGLELPAAIEAVQEFGLVPRLEQRSYPDPSSKGKIMEQTPGAGSSVRVGREVVLIMSKGALIDKISNYVGRNAEEVRQELKVMFPGDNPMLFIGNIAFAFDQTEAGIIIAQEPEPGAALNSNIGLKLLVSRGKDATLKEVPAVLGLPWAKAVEDLMALEIPFDCSLTSLVADTTPGTIISQEPSAAATLPAGNRVKIALTKPENVGSNQVFAIREVKLPEYAVAVEVTVSQISASGSESVIYKFKHPGGMLSFPYLVSDNTELVVTAFGKEIDRFLVKKN